VTLVPADVIKGVLCKQARASSAALRSFYFFIFIKD